MLRLLVVLARAFTLGVALMGSALADPTASPSTRAAAAEPGAVRAKNAGTIEGQVLAVDYRAGTITVQSGSRRIDVVVLPSTNIQGHDNFHTIADIEKGSHVEIILSERAGTFVAQIIRLR